MELKQFVVLLPLKEVSFILLDIFAVFFIDVSMNGSALSFIDLETKGFAAVKHDAAGGKAILRPMQDELTEQSILRFAEAFAVFGDKRLFFEGSSLLDFLSSRSLKPFLSKCKTAWGSITG